MAGISTSLLKIVAEAASAYRTGSDVYVVAQDVYPYEREVFYSYDGSTDPKKDAEDFLSVRQAEEGWHLFGPYVTGTEEPASAWTALNYRITVDIMSPDGEATQRIYGEEEEIDALFLTLPAVDKFVVPYYTSVLGADRAREIRREFLASPGPLGHVWNTRRI